MRVLRILLAVICFTICLPAGFVVLFTAFQLNTVIQKSKPTPEEITAAQLVENGVPENLHVQLTGFTFGAPVIEPNKEGWECVWLPVVPEPKPKKASKQTIFFHAN